MKNALLNFGLTSQSISAEKNAFIKSDSALCRNTDNSRIGTAVCLKLVFFVIGAAGEKIEGINNNNNFDENVSII